MADIYRTPQYSLQLYHGSHYSDFAVDITATAQGALFAAEDPDSEDTIYLDRSLIGKAAREIVLSLKVDSEGDDVVIALLPMGIDGEEQVDMLHRVYCPAGQSVSYGIVGNFTKLKISVNDGDGADITMLSLTATSVG